MMSFQVDLETVAMWDISLIPRSLQKSYQCLFILYSQNGKTKLGLIMVFWEFIFGNILSWGSFWYSDPRAAERRESGWTTEKTRGEVCCSPTELQHPFCFVDGCLLCHSAI